MKDLIKSLGLKQFELVSIIFLLLCVSYSSFAEGFTSNACNKPLLSIGKLDSDTSEARLIYQKAILLFDELKYDTALNLIDQTIEIYESNLGKDHIILAELYTFKGNCFLNLSNVQELYASAYNAFRIAQLNYGNEDKKLRIYLNRLGSVYSVMGKDKERIQLLKKYLSPFKNESNQDYIEFSATYGHIGSAYFAIKELDSCIHYQKLALMYLNKSGQNVDKYKPTEEKILASAYLQKGYIFKAEEIMYNIINNNKLELDQIQRISNFRIMGNIYLAKGDELKAIDYFNLAINEIITENLQGYFKALGNLNFDIAKSYFNIGKYDKATSYFSKSLDYIIKYNKNDARIIANNNEYLGLCAMKLHDNNKAIGYFNKSLEGRIKLDSFSVDAGLSYSNIGDYYLNLLEYEKAKDFYHKSFKIFTIKNSEKNMVEVLNRLAILELKSENLSEAEKHHWEALKICKYSINKSPDSLRFLKSVVTQLKGIASIQLEKQKVNSNKDNIQDAITLLLESERIIDYMRSELSSSTKEYFSSSYKDIYKILIECYKYQEGINNNIEKIFRLFEKSKAITLLEGTKKSFALNFGDIPDSIINLEHEILVDINYNSKQINDWDNLKVKDENILFQLKVNEARLRDKRDKLNLFLESHYANYYSLKYGNKYVELKDVRDALVPNKSMIQYFTLDSNIYVVVINKETSQIIEIKKDFGLNQEIENLLFNITAFKTKPDLSDKFDSLNTCYLKSAQLLYNKLIKPFNDKLEKSIIIIPDGMLGYLPFEMLLVEKPTDSRKMQSYHYFLKDHILSYSYSATMQKEMEIKYVDKTNRINITAFAPYYTGDTTILSKVFAYTDVTRRDLNPLPYSGNEAIGVSKIMNGNYFVGKSATKEVFLKNSSSRILHLATHGQANDISGDYCFLVFNENKESNQNEILFARDIYTLKLNAELVTLSACETGIGELKEGEGIISLARAFTYAGAKSIVTSLWQISDAKTKDLMIDFYKNLKKGMRKDEALWQAKIDYLSKNKGEAASPFYWAAFIGIGDMGKL